MKFCFQEKDKHFCLGGKTKMPTKIDLGPK